MKREDRKNNRIGILGGTFDPIHMGHKILGCAAMREAELEKLIVMPTYIQPFKQDRETADSAHRLKMAELCFKGIEGVEVSDFEIEKGTVSYTYDTLSALERVYPERDLFFILGADSLLLLDTWYKGIELLENFSFITGLRPGYDEEIVISKAKEYKEKYGSEVIIIKEEMPDISATEIRNRLKAKESADNLLPLEVERYIYENRLYEQ